MTKRNYVLNLRHKLDDSPDNEFLQYLYDNRHNADMDSTICVQIPDYCDADTVDTIKSCLTAAANPDRIHLAVCYQGDDLDELHTLQSFPNCKVDHIEKANAAGLCFARNRCNNMISDETYVLHVDSHMRFAPFWDVAVIQQWSDCNDDKAIISCYCPDALPYLDKPFGDDSLLPSKTNGRFINPTHFDNNTVRLRFHANCFFNNTDKKPRRSAFISGHMVFAKSELDRIVPSDPDMFFVADEISIAVRYFTHGFNVYQPAYRFIYHMFGRTKTMEKHKNVKIERFNPAAIFRRDAELLRMEQLFDVEDHNIDMGIYGNGSVRTIAEFEAYSGIDFKKKTINNFAYNGAYDVPHTEDDYKLYDWRVDRPVGPSKKANDKTILVMIPAYKDPLLLQTVQVLKNNADYPARIHFAICFQDDNMQLYADLSAIENVNLVHVKPEDAKGIGYAYHMTQHLIENHDYVLYCDAHTYAVKGWDTYNIECIDLLGDKAVISNWAYGFDPDNPPTKPQKGCITSILSISHQCYLNISFSSHIECDYPVRGCVITGSNVFGKAQFMLDCPYDPDMKMNSAEAFHSLALWTHGYDIYHTPKRYFFHYFVDRNKHNESDKDRIEAKQQRRNEERNVSIPRLKKYIGIIDDSNKYIDLGDYIPGTVRSIKAFELFAGIDFEHNKVSMKSYFGHFTNDSHLTNRFIDNCALDKYRKSHNYSVRDIADMISNEQKVERFGIKFLK